MYDESQEAVKSVEAVAAPPFSVFVDDDDKRYTTVLKNAARFYQLSVCLIVLIRPGLNFSSTPTDLKLFSKHFLKLL